jgi:hypothetical protein
MFEKATRIKLRFNYRGKLSVEDLWDLSLEDLDKMYGLLRGEQKAANNDSLLKTATKETTLLNLRVDLVKHVVETKLAEKNARKARAVIKLQKEKIAAIIEKKQDEGLENMSVEELQKAMDELKA